MQSEVYPLSAFVRILNAEVNDGSLKPLATKRTSFYVRRDRFQWGENMNHTDIPVIAATAAVNIDSTFTKEIQNRENWLNLLNTIRIAMEEDEKMRHLKKTVCKGYCNLTSASTNSVRLLFCC